MVNPYRLQKLGAVDQFVMMYGGLRGAVAFALGTLYAFYFTFNIFLLIVYYNAFYKVADINLIINLNFWT